MLGNHKMRTLLAIMALAIPAWGDTAYVIFESSTLTSSGLSANIGMNIRTASAVTFVAQQIITTSDSAATKQTALKNAVIARAALLGITLTASDVILWFDVNNFINTGVVDDMIARATLASPTFTGTVGGITTAMVGLGNVDNTSDVSKPVSTAQQAALDLKATLTSLTVSCSGTDKIRAIGADGVPICSTDMDISPLTPGMPAARKAISSDPELTDRASILQKCNAVRRTNCRTRTF